MSISAHAFSSKEFYLAFQPETTMGTAKTDALQKLNIDDIPSVTQNMVQTLDVRGHEGRILHTGDVYTTDKMQMTTITANFILDTTVAQALLENVTGIEDDASVTGAVNIEITGAYTPPTYEHGATYSDNIHTMTVVVVSPESGETRVFPGCVVTEMSVDMDAGTEGGRAKGSITFSTGYRPLDGQDSSGFTFSSYGSGHHYLHELKELKRITVGGSAHDLVLSKVGFKISNPIARFGFQGANADPEGYARAIPEITIEGSVSAKYDAQTASLWENRRAGDYASVTVSNSTTINAATFLIYFPACYMTSDVNPTANDAGAIFDLSLRSAAVGSSTDALIIHWPTS